MGRKLALLLITLWVGGLWVTGITANTLFNVIGDRMLAGEIAGQLFTTISYIGIGAGLYLLLQRYLEEKAVSFKQAYFWVIVTMLLLVIVGHFGIQTLLADIKADALPNAVMDSEYASQFAAWHGVAGVIYLIECLLGVALVVLAKR